MNRVDRYLSTFIHHMIGFNLGILVCVVGAHFDVWKDPLSAFAWSIIIGPILVGQYRE